jgi:hypothetical protein
MPATTEMAKLKRDLTALVEAADLDLRQGSRTPMRPSERRALRSEIEKCMQELDELRTRLAG